MAESKVIDILNMLKPVETGPYGVALPTPAESEEFREMFAALYSPAAAVVDEAGEERPAGEENQAVAPPLSAEKGEETPGFTALDLNALISPLVSRSAALLEVIGAVGEKEAAAPSSAPALPIPVFEAYAGRNAQTVAHAELSMDLSGELYAERVVSALAPEEAVPLEVEGQAPRQIATELTGVLPRQQAIELLASLPQPEAGPRAVVENTVIAMPAREQAAVAEPVTAVPQAEIININAVSPPETVPSPEVVQLLASLGVETLEIEQTVQAAPSRVDVEEPLPAVPEAKVAAPQERPIAPRTAAPERSAGVDPVPEKTAGTDSRIATAPLPEAAAERAVTVEEAHAAPAPSKGENTEPVAVARTGVEARGIAEDVALQARPELETRETEVRPGVARPAQRNAVPVVNTVEVVEAAPVVEPAAVENKAPAPTAGPAPVYRQADEGVAGSALSSANETPAAVEVETLSPSAEAVKVVESRENIVRPAAPAAAMPAGTEELPVGTARAENMVPAPPAAPAPVYRQADEGVAGTDSLLRQGTSSLGDSAPQGGVAQEASRAASVVVAPAGPAETSPVDVKPAVKPVLTPAAAQNAAGNALSGEEGAVTDRVITNAPAAVENKPQAVIAAASGQEGILRADSGGEETPRQADFRHSLRPELRTSADILPAAQVLEGRRDPIEGLAFKVSHNLAMAEGETMVLGPALVRRLSEVLVDGVRKQYTQIRLQLKPPSLGKLYILLRVEEGQLIAHMQVTSQEVKTALLNNASDLQASLRDQDLNLARFTVDVAPDFSQGQSAAHPGAGRQVRNWAPGVGLPAENGVEARELLDRVKMGINAIDLLA